MSGEATENAVEVGALVEFEAVFSALFVDGTGFAEGFGGPNFVLVSSFRHEHVGVEASADGVAHPSAVLVVAHR